MYGRRVREQGYASAMDRDGVEISRLRWGERDMAGNMRTVYSRGVCFGGMLLIRVSSVLCVMAMGCPVSADDFSDLIAARSYTKQSFGRTESVLRRLCRSPEGNVAREARFLLTTGTLKWGRDFSKPRALAELRALASESARDEWSRRAGVELARHQMGIGDMSGAERVLDGILASNIGDPQAVLAAELLGDLRIEASRKEDAISAYEHGLSLLAFLKSPDGPYHTAELPGTIDSQRLRGKLAALRRKKKVSGDAEPYRTYKAALRAMQEGDSDKALVLFRKVIENHVDHELASASSYRIGLCLREQGEIEAAAACWRELIDADATGDWCGDAHVALGDLMLECRLDAAAAEKCYHAAVSRTGKGASWIHNEADAYEGLGLCFLLRENYSGAAACFEKELRLRPTRTIGSHRLPSPMEHLLHMCRKEQFPVHAPSRVMRGTKAVQTAIFLGCCYSECGSYAEAMDLFDRVHLGSLRPTFPSQRACALYEKAEVHRLRQELEAAQDTYEQCVQSYPATDFAPMSLMELASLQFSQGKNDSARKAYELLWRRYPKSPQAPRAYYYHGYSNFVCDDFVAAEKAFKMLMAKHGGSWEAEHVKMHYLPKIGEQTSERGNRK